MIVMFSFPDMHWKDIQCPHKIWIYSQDASFFNLLRVCQQSDASAAKTAHRHDKMWEVERRAEAPGCKLSRLKLISQKSEQIQELLEECWLIAFLIFLLLQVSHTTIKKPGTHWQEALLCRYTMDRLFSFSILVARVFAVGDPAHHAKSSVQNCTEHQMCVCWNAAVGLFKHP